MKQNVFARRSALITGGLGFIGSNLARRLLDLGARVTVVDSLIPECGGNLFNIEGIQGQVRVSISDVRNTRIIERLVRGQDYLFNLAGLSSHLDSMRDPMLDIEMNCNAQLSVLEACRKRNQAIKIVFASTRQIYGKPDYLPVDEEHPLRPIDINGVHKLAGEQYHTIYHHAHGVRSCSLRLTNTIGPRMRVKDARQTFLGLWIRRLLEGDPLEVWGGKQLRDLCYIDDAVDAFLCAASSERAWGQVFNIGGGGTASLESLARTLIRLNGGGRYATRSYPADRRRIDIGDYYADSKKIGRALGWKPKVDLEEALDRTLRYYRERLNRYL